MEIVLTILILNTLLTGAHFLRFKSEKQTYPFLIMFLTAPLIGLVLYYIPRFLLKRRSNLSLSDREYILVTNGVEDYATRPKVEEEMNIIPFEEALAVSDAGEKRGLLLGLLKENMTDNLKVTMSALEDRDSETSHYAAAATMEIARKLRNSIQETEELYLNNSEKPEIERKYMEELFEYINSGVLSGRDRMIQLTKYMKISEEMLKHREGLLITDYTNRIRFLMELNQMYEAEQLAKDGLKKFEGEEIYLQLMEIYFRLKNQVEFNHTLTMLCNSKVVLSTKGIDVVRFWRDRG